MYIVGLTGGIGSGKSTVTRWLQETATDQLTVIDADEISREIVAPGSPILPKLQERFGADILDVDGHLRRSELAKRAFATATATQDLNAIMHPAIRQRIQDQIAAAQTPLVLLDHPLLLETHSNELVDEVLLVQADEAVRLQRLVEDRGLDAADVRNRMRRQLSDAERSQQADYLLDNSGSMAQLEAQLRQWWQQVQQRIA